MADRWVADQMHSVFGFSDRTAAQYILAVGKKSKSAASLLDWLKSEYSLKEDAPTRAFAAALFDKVGQNAAPAMSGQKVAARQAVKQAIVQRKKEESYRMLSDDEEEVVVTKKEKKKKIEKKKNIRKREDRTGEDEPSAIRKPKKAKDEDEDEDEWDEHEKARAKDLEERDGFAERLKEKDKEKTKKLGGSSRQAAIEVAKRKELEKAANRKALMPELRSLARQQYLGPRAMQKLDELRADIRDEETIFQGENSKAELDRLAKKKAILKVVEEYTQLDEKSKTDLENNYSFPDKLIDEDKGTRDVEAEREILTKRYKDDDVEEGRGPAWEQEDWENKQSERASMGVGTKGKVEAMRSSGKDVPKDYDYVFEDLETTFVMMETQKGDRKDEDPDVVRETELQKKKRTMTEVRASLPVYAYREPFLAAVKAHQVLIIVGETGSGKTTQLPQYLWEEGYCKNKKMVGCTQPRRVAAMSVAARVADESSTKLGSEVGYSIRFEDCTSERTVLKYMTDGMLLREFLSEPDLNAYSCIMVDEAHERTLHTDVLFGLVRSIAAFRPELKLLISSATMDAQKFSGFFDDAPIFKIPGRRYPVEIMYTKAPEADYIDAAVVTILQIHLTQPAGDILLFLSGQDEIESCEANLSEKMRKFGSKVAELIILPIYANLPSDMQAKIFEPCPPGSRKVILGTNIAETSLTIDGIIYIIDPGFCKQKSYNPRSGMESLVVTPCSQASANQRAGRAGRVAPGKAFRLYTAWAFQNELEENTIPEIQRTNLGNVVLLLKSLGIDDLIHFDFMDPPPAETLIRALEQLYALGALNDRGELTKMGRRMAEFPVDPMLSKMLIVSEKYGVVEEILSITAMLQIGGALFYRPKDRAVHADNARKAFNKDQGDHITLLHIWNEWKETDYSTQWCFENFIQHRSMNRARDVREQLLNLMERVEVELSSSPEDTTAILKAVTAGFFYHTARMGKGGGYKTVKQSQSVQIHPTSSLFETVNPPRWVVYFELVFTSKEFMRQVIEIESKWLLEVAPHYYKAKEVEDETNRKMPKTSGKSSATDYIDLNPHGPGQD
eukprot:m.96001 g.96001  ORF g.96001 m.96001 type:complete len:1070 (+) comp26859_c0_seq1:164-3373(+)